VTEKAKEGKLLQLIYRESWHGPVTTGCKVHVHSESWHGSVTCGAIGKNAFFPATGACHACLITQLYFLHYNTVVWIFSLHAYLVWG
jgi:hypothetical protein